MASGMNIVTGKTLEGTDYLDQCIADVLSTHTGEVCMLRDYGSRLRRYVDANMLQPVIVSLQAHVTEVLTRWLGRLLTITRVRVFVDPPTVTLVVAYNSEDGLNEVQLEL